MKLRYFAIFLALGLLVPGTTFSQKAKRKGAPELAEKSTSKLDLRLEKSVIFSKSFTGFALFDPEKREMLYEYNAGKYFTPASNTKILTFYTCLRMLGDSIPALQYSKQGELLIFWGTGDPSFLNPNLPQSTQVFNFLKNREEQLLFCPANFKDQRYGPGWMWDDSSYDYQAEKSPFPVYGNLVYFQRNNGSTVIETQPHFLEGKLQVNAASGATDYITRAEFDNRFILNESFADGRAFKIGVPFHYSPEFLVKVLEDTLHRPVGVLDFDLPPPPDAGTIYSQQADSLYRQMLQESDNFIAEQLLLLCSWQRSGKLNADATIEYSMKNFMTGLPDELQWVDGSGLSRYNLMTPRSIVEILHRIYQLVQRPRLLNIFPAGGVSGTIANSYRNGGSPYVFAKTGTLRNNHCLSGYLITQKGKLLIFSFMHNNFTGGTASVKKEMERVLREVYQVM